ncbi:MAG: hypothetical protein AAF564_11195 [Bacteroidota bacterium]
MKSDTINWFAIFIEAFFVVLGVFLALAVNNWRDDYNKQQRAEVALKSIIEEIDVNRIAVNEAILYHTGLMDTLYKHMRAYGVAAENKPGMDVFTGGFVNPAEPLSRAWETANATGVVENMPYTQVLLISNVYKYQEQYEVLSTTFGQEIYRRMFNEGVDGIGDNFQNLAQIIGSFAYTECNLAAEYINVLTSLEDARADRVNADSLDTAGAALNAPIFCDLMPQ